VVLFKQNVRRYKTDFHHARPWFKTRKGTKLKVRLMRPDDADRLIEFFHRLSPESRWRRFHTNVEHVSDELVRNHAQEFVNIDNRTLVGAVIAVYEDDEGEHIVGSARLARPNDDPTAPEAEAAIVVRDDYQGQGVGQELLRRLVLLAKQMQVKTILAIFQQDNEGAIRLFRELNLPSVIRHRHGETEMRIEVPYV
jgi:RimJ/RimL family protein N-acetyltransferase